MSYELESKTDESIGDFPDARSVATPENGMRSILQSNLTVKLALMCCKDLLPFDIIDGSGFQQFLVDCGIVTDRSQIPSSSTVHKDVMFNMYHSTLETISSSLGEAEPTLALTLEESTDRDIVYHTWRFHFSNEKFEQLKVAMPTIIMKKSTEEQDDFVREIESFCEQFNLLNKSIIVISENIHSDDTPLVSNCLKVHQHYCIAHSLVKLVNIDGISNGLESSGLATNLYKHLKSSNIETQGSNSLRVAYAHFEDYVKAMSTCPHSFEKHFISWNALIILLEHVENESRQLSCSKSKIQSRILTEDNYSELNQILTFLKHLRQAFEILNGTPYTSCALVLLLRAEIQRLLSLNDGDCELLKKLKKSMEEVLPHKFPVNELHVCAALLDPSQRDWSCVQDYLARHQVTPIEFLSSMLQKFSITEALEDSKPLENTFDNSETKPTCIESQTLDKEPPWKKAKLEILARHVTCSEASEMESELHQYMCSFLSRGSYDEPLLWWKDQKEKFPKLTKLAKIVLTIPASCSTVENISKLTERHKASELSMHRDDLVKMLFIHNNCHMIESMT